MSVTQWILLIVAVAVVIGIYLYSRRDRRAMHRHRGERSKHDHALLLPPVDQQLEIFGDGDFDEFGVGKARPAGTRPGTRRDPPPAAPPDVPAEVLSGERMEDEAAPPPRPAAPKPAPSRRESHRRRIEPSMGFLAEPALSSPRAADAGDAADAARGTEATLGLGANESGHEDETGPSRQPPATSTAADGSGSRDGAAAEQRIISLLLARRGGDKVQGEMLHAALRKEKLEYGEHGIYHRNPGAQSSFSVASLVKPGYLDPEAAEGFSTPGLMFFMVLPGPAEPMTAIRDMLATAGRLADVLDAQVYDASRAPLDIDAKRELRREVEAWVARHGDS